MFCEKCGSQLNESDKFCGRCGNSLILTNTQSVTKISVEEARKLKRKAILWLISPFIVYVVVFVFWGIINVIYQGQTTSASDDFFTAIVEFLDNVVIPFILGLAFLAIPFVIAVSIFYYQKSKQ
jgi:uncharacterized membrane protein YvbJ